MQAASTPLHSSSRWRHARICAIVVPKGRETRAGEPDLGSSVRVNINNKTYKKLLKKMGEKPSPLYGPALKADFVAEHAAFGKILASIGVKKK